MIPEAAVEAAENAYRETLTELRLAEGGGFKVASQVKRSLHAALEAAAPHMGADVLEEWAVQFASGAVEEADGQKDAERKLREIRECIADGMESPTLEPMTVVHRYRLEESELTQWKMASP